jgi:hypothetical protein
MCSQVFFGPQHVGHCYINVFQVLLGNNIFQQSGPGDRVPDVK